MEPAQIGTAIAAFILVAVMPVKLAAHWVGAERTGFVPVLLAVLVSGALAGLAQQVAFVGPVLSVLAGTFVFKLVLGTTMPRAFVISVLAVVIVIGAVLAVFGTAALTRAF